MTDLVDPDEIETIVGVKRHPIRHWARAVHAEQTVYILHSQACRESTPDLRDCPYSHALDRGIQHHIPWTGWRRALNRPVPVEIFHGYLVPALASLKESE